MTIEIVDAVSGESVASGLVFQTRKSAAAFVAKLGRRMGRQLTWEVV